MQTESSRARGTGIVQAAVVIAWTAGLVWLAWGRGEDAPLVRFIRSDYWWLVYTAVGILIAFIASLTIRPSHEQGPHVLRRFLQTGILILPLLYLPLAVTSELSIAAAEKRSLYAPRVAVSGSQAPKPVKRQQRQQIAAVPEKPAPAPVKRPEPSLLDLVTDPEDFEGSDVTLLGMVHRDKRLAADSFFCYRLVMVCCAADATPAGIIVKWPSSAKFKTGAWVKVHGKVVLTKFEGADYPAISADKVEKITPPKNQFIIPK